MSFLPTIDENAFTPVISFDPTKESTFSSYTKEINKFLDRNLLLLIVTMVLIVICINLKWLYSGLYLRHFFTRQQD